MARYIRMKVSLAFVAMSLIFTLETGYAGAQINHDPSPPNEKSQRVDSKCKNCSCCVDSECDTKSFCKKGCLAGYHGGKCFNKCPTECKNCIDHVDTNIWNTGYCTTDNCKEGYYSTEIAYQCQNKCPSECLTCVSATDCKSCKTEYFLILQKDGTGYCSLCPDKCISCNISQPCIGCESGYFLDQQVCKQCSTNCYSCVSLNECTACKFGYYGWMCRSQCSPGCKNTFCDKSTGGCECKPGFVGSKCDTCVTGMYGSNCSRNCPNNCIGGSCSMHDGTCFGCMDGNFGNQCNSDCPVNCNNSKCDQYDGNCLTGCTDNYDGLKCEDCVTGYFGNDCYSECPVKCSGPCERNAGTCFSCTDHFNGPNCDTCQDGFFLYSHNTTVTESSKCEACPDNCKMCAGSNSCSECVSEYFGPSCKQRCSFGCKNISCMKENGKCRFGCKENFNGSLCDECITGKYGNNCNFSCPMNCNTTTCYRDSGNCFGCLVGFDGHKCDSCIEGLHGPSCNLTCPNNCKNSSCDRDYGKCSHGCEGNFEGMECDRCIAGKYGIDCLDKCPSHCKGNRCNQTTGLCAACKINFTGLKCENCTDGKHGVNCTVDCPKTCQDQKCTRGQGTCFSCRKGIYGLTCERKCSTFCDNDTCDQASGNCICKAGYSGDKCCLNNSFCETCYHNGSCKECVEAMYGQNCETQCPYNCIGRCNRTDGACFSCKDGFVGTDCAKSEERIGGKLPTAAIAGGAAGGIVLFVIVGLLAFFLYRRNKSTDTAKTNILKRQTEKEFKANNIYLNQMALHDIEKEKAPSRKLNQQPSDTVDPGDIEMDESEDDGADKPPVLENEYVNTVRRIQAVRLSEYIDSKEKEFFDREFKELPKGMQKTHNAAKRPENQGKCRYGSIYPYDDTRVKLKGLQTDFINASYINGYRKPKEYIACLGPTVKAMDKFVTFWHMVWQEKSEIIVMVTNLMEKGGMKCEQYWPAIGTMNAYDGVKVTCHSEDNYAEYTVRSFTLSKGNEQRRLHHIHFTAWPDKGVPDDVTSLIEFRQRVRATDVILGGPIIVHCSAGVGRTGTYIALDILTQEGEKENNVNIFGCVFNLRHQRTTMVQTVEQYEYLHRALVHSLTYGCEPIPAEEFQEYVNTCSDALMNSKFDKLRTTKEHVSEDENDAIVRNKELSDVNRKHVDIPGDMYRPRLYKFKVMGESDFINATFVNSFKQKNRYIVCQTPLPTTVEDFLTLVLQENVACIVSLDPTTNVGEDVGQYIPADNSVLIVGHFEVSTTKATTVAGSYTYRRITVKIPNKTGAESKDVHHYQFNNWSDRQKVPGDPTKFLKLITDTEKQSDDDGRSCHIIVHCLNAAERSGLFCAVSTLLQKMEIEHEVSVVNTLRQVKIRRQLAIPNKEQYVFCHQCVSAYLQTFDSSEYANFTPKF